MKYAIATASGQTRFLTHSQAWALAPDERIKLFATRKEADNHRLANLTRFPALITLESMSMPVSDTSTGGTIVESGVPTFTIR